MDFTVKTYPSSSQSDARPRKSKTGRGIAVGVAKALAMGVAALLLMTAFSWPLARHATRGIAYTAFERGTVGPHAMLPGDPLQFLYHLWLAQDTFAGRTRLFTDPWEFNTGDDADRRAPGTYYLPFSAFFAVGSWFGGRAFGWNFTAWVSLWLTGLFAWALARRLLPRGNGPALPLLLALIPLAFPYTWANLLGGSPTGLALMWVPALFWGLDRWSGDASAAGAGWAGAALFLSAWSDTHVFFFSALAAPAWVLFAWCRQCGFRWPTRHEWTVRLVSAWPLVLCVLLAAGQVWLLERGLRDTAVAAGRSDGEVSLFSVPLSGLWRNGGLAKIHVGIPALVLAAMLALAALAGLCGRRTRRCSACLLALLAGMAGIAVLATGTASVAGAFLRRAMVRLVPPYGMIRQADKIFCLMPCLAMAACALGLRLVPPTRTPVGRRVRAAVLAAILLAVGTSWALRHRPGICLVDSGQGAYAAVAADAAARGIEPHALALPLWPGDSHLSSLYQHAASLHRIRMLNGYRPTVRETYRNRIFLPLESVNLGWPSDDQLRLLDDCKVGYLLFHEDAFPEKAGSFPSGSTLANLLRHPRLRYLARDRGVWAFRILGKGELKNASSGAVAGISPPELPVLFPVRVWNWKNSVFPDAPGTETLPGDAAGSAAFLRVRVGSPAVTGRCFRVAGPWNWEWRFRARGHAGLEWTTYGDDGTATAVDTASVDADDWTWYAIPAPSGDTPADPFAARELAPAFRIVSGEADMDTVVLTAHGTFPPLLPGETCAIPAIAFFRGGCSNPEDGSVTFTPADTPAGEALHAGNLPLGPGPVSVCFDADTPAPERTLLGTLLFRVGVGPGAVSSSFPILSGQTADFRLDIPDNRFVRISFRYSGQAPCTVRGIFFARPPAD